MRTHTSVTPIHDCPEDKHSLSSASARCSGSGTHAVGGQRQGCTFERGEGRTLQIPQAALHSSLVAET